MGIRDKVKVNEVSNNITDMKVTIAGNVKTGKSTLFYEILKRQENGLDSGLLLAFEKGYSFLEGINVVDVTTWQEFVGIVDDLVKDNEGFRFLALDTVDIAGKLCQQYVLRKASAKDGKRYEALADIPFGKAYELLEEEFSKQIQRLEQAGFGLFFITHHKEKKIEEKSGLSYDKIVASVSGRVGDYVRNTSDFIVFIDTEKERVKDGRTQKLVENRKIRFRGDGTTEAGGRIKELPETIDYDVDVFLETIKSAIDNQKAKSGVTVSKPKEESTPKKETVVKELEQPVEDTSNLEIDAIKEKMGSILGDLPMTEKRKWASKFKAELGDANYTKSDDVDKLAELLAELVKS